MTNILKKAIENLYAIFETYRLPPAMEGCPCCVSQNDKKNIHVKHLRDLNEDELSGYAFKAMTTWGNTNDFKHYLPRIFELLASTDFIVEPQPYSVNSHMPTGRNGLKLKKQLLNSFYWPGGQTLQRINLTLTKMPLLKFINIQPTLSTCLMIGKSTSPKIVFYRLSIWCMTTTPICRIGDWHSKKWMQKNSPALEKGFFEFAGRDEALAERIATAQYIYEHQTPKQSGQL